MKSTHDPLLKEFEQRLEQLQNRIALAVARRGPGPEPLLIGVSKTQPVSSLKIFIELGLRNFGENYVQEFYKKHQALLTEDLCWHFIGRLQSNKLKHLVGSTLIHTVDRIELLPLIEKYAAQLNIVQDVLVQVNLAGELQKAGVEPTKLYGLLSQFTNFDHVRCRGLMLLPPQASPEATRPLFAKLRQLRDQLATSPMTNVHLEHLSMGMSHDFEVAIEEGTTMIRIGTALFGER